MSVNVESTKSPAGLVLWTAVIAVVLILGGAWIVISRVPPDAGAAASALEPAPAAGHPAPDFTLQTLDGRQVSLSDFRGRPVIVNFWATWCPPCRAEMPEFQNAYLEYQDRGLVILGVNSTVQDDPELVPGFVAEFGLTFPILLDEEGEATSAYRILGLPTSVFIDSRGVVKEVFTGPVNKAYIAAQIPGLF